MNDRVLGYYNLTAHDYDALHNETSNAEHTEALSRAWPLICQRDIRSVLDVGCGTGRTLSWIVDAARKSSMTLQRRVGVDPSEALLKIACDKVLDCEWVAGDAHGLPFQDGEFSLVVATGILHHVDDPKQVISEMFRVSSDVVIISDHNNFAFGGRAMKRLRLLLHSLGLLEAATYMKQGFKRQGYSKDDGWWYPYSLLSDVDVVQKKSESFFFYPTRKYQGSKENILTAFSHGAFLCFKKAIV